MKGPQDNFILNNGNTIPCIGYGTWRTPDGDLCVESTLCAISAGYRHIDTAAYYKNEPSVGEAIKKSSLSRDEIFVTSKLWNTEHSYEKAIQALDGSLSRLGLDYLDLYLIHWPRPACVRDSWEEANAQTWRAFEDMQKAGKIKNIGVSNFMPKHLDALLSSASITPAVNQIEYHIGQITPETVNYCSQKGILIEAWAPLNRGLALENAQIAKIAAAHGKSTAQIHLRYCVQNGILPLPKSVTPERIRENLEIFDFALTDEEMATLDALPYLGGSGHDPDNIAF